MLQTLPTSMQLELLQRLREAKMARNRESFQQRAAQPASFSSFQMEEYLKASALRRAAPPALFPSSQRGTSWRAAGMCPEKHVCCLALVQPHSPTLLGLPGG